MTVAYRLELTGGFRLISADGSEIRISGRKGRALVAIVASSLGLSVSRAKLIGLLWGDRGEQQAADSLRQQLALLRKDLAPGADAILAIHDDQVGLAEQAIDIDVKAIREAMVRGDIAEASRRYGGQLLEGLDLGNQAFEEWLSAQRHELTNTMTEVLTRVAELEHGTARIAIAQRLVDLDPLRETSHRALISSAIAAGEAALARKHYDACAAMLQRELGVKPDPETTALLDELAHKPISRATIASMPSIAVLPFANLSDAADQKFFSEGVSADIATELHRFRSAIVRAVTSTTTSSDADAPLTRGKALGVNFVVAGSIRRMGKRLRISVQLIDVEQAEQTWTERFDVPEDDVFDVQDRIVQSISAQLAKVIRGATITRSKRKPPQHLAAYELVLRADALQMGDRNNEAEAIRLYEQASQLDPTYGRAHGGVGFILAYKWLRDYEAPTTILDAALERTRLAITLDDNDSLCHIWHAEVLMFRQQHELALHHFRRALALNPNDPFVHGNNGIIHGFRGNWQVALEHFDQVLLLDPHYNESWYWRDRGVAHFVARQYDLAVSAFERSPTPQEWVEAYLAACHVYSGNMARAAEHVAQALRLEPQLTIERLLSRDPYCNTDDKTHLSEGMKLAGFR